MNLDEARNHLRPFLDLHPYSSVEEIQNVPGKFRIDSPFGDNSFSLSLADDFEKSVEILNRLRLPEKYSAIWHLDSSRFEVAYHVADEDDEKDDVYNRSFEFIHRGLRIRCEFASSSAELLHLGLIHRPETGFTSTRHRNLNSYWLHMISQTEDDFLPQSVRDAYQSGKPRSFWIDGLSWDDESILDVVQHINFYMSYYDTDSPTILVHETKAETTAEDPVDRYIENSFPSIIKSIELDPNLLHFWEASKVGDPARRFLYNYQILEYAAFYVVEKEISKDVMRILSAPHIYHRPDEIAARIIEKISVSKISDAQKIESLLRDHVRVEKVWREVERNLEYFSKNINFDGGYACLPITKNNWSCADFSNNWASTVSNAMRGLRNALSHGREQRMTSVVTPTFHNLELLRPWVPVISACAREVMIYRSRG